MKPLHTAMLLLSLLPTALLAQTAPLPPISEPDPIVSPPPSLWTKVGSRSLTARTPNGIYKMMKDRRWQNGSEVYSWQKGDNGLRELAGLPPRVIDRLDQSFSTYRFTGPTVCAPEDPRLERETLDGETICYKSETFCMGSSSSTTCSCSATACSCPVYNADPCAPSGLPGSGGSSGSVGHPPVHPFAQERPALKKIKREQLIERADAVVVE